MKKPDELGLFYFVFSLSYFVATEISAVSGYKLQFISAYG